MIKMLLRITLALFIVFSPLFINGVEAAKRFKVGSSSSVKVTLYSNMFPRGRTKNPATAYAKVSIGLTQPQSQVKIDLYDENWKWLTSWVARNGDRIDLGNDHKAYYMKVSKYKQSGWTSNTCYFYQPTNCSTR